MAWSEIEVYGRLIARTAPGPGIEIAPSGVPGNAHLKMKSIPNVDTGRLLNTRRWLHHQVHTTDGLADFDQPRRTLVNTGLRIRLITHELQLRGEPEPACPFCRVDAPIQEGEQ